MKIFEIIVLPLLALLFLRSLSLAWRAPRRRLRHSLGAAVWLAAGIAVANAHFTTWIAEKLGIGRGADLLLYVLALGSIAVAFNFFERMERLESQLTKLVRALAIEEGLRRSEQRSEPR